MSHRWIAHGRGKPKLQYLVHWAGYGGEHDSWEPEVNLRDAPDPVAKYEQYLHTVGQDFAPPAGSRVKLGKRSGARHKRWFAGCNHGGLRFAAMCTGGLVVLNLKWKASGSLLRVTSYLALMRSVLD